jgi:hypothetical protein
MPSILEDDDFDPKKIYDDLIKGCREVKEWDIRCIVEESFVGHPPFKFTINDGIYFCRVVTPTLRDAFILVADSLPVIKFLNYTNE